MTYRSLVFLLGPTQFVCVCVCINIYIYAYTKDSPLGLAFVYTIEAGWSYYRTNVVTYVPLNPRTVDHNQVVNYAARRWGHRHCSALFSSVPVSDSFVVLDIHAINNSCNYIYTPSHLSIVGLRSVPLNMQTARAEGQDEHICVLNEGIYMHIAGGLL